MPNRIATLPSNPEPLKDVDRSEWDYQRRWKLTISSKTEACCRIAHEVETRWPVKANKPFKKALKVAWDEVQTDKPEAVVLCILKAQQVSLPSSATVLPSPAAPAAAGGGSPAPTGGQPAAAAAAEKG